MEELAGASLNVDVTKFLEDDMEETISMLHTERQYNELVLFKMLEEGLKADITLTTQGGFVKAHRCVLSAVSPVFKAMFQHDMKEQLSCTVNIPEMTIGGLQLFLLVLYTINEHLIITESDGNSCEEPEQKPLPWLFSAGINKYFDEFFRALLKYQALRWRLESLLENALGRNLTPNNCWEYYDKSLQFNGNYTISSTVRKYIIDNFQAVVKSGEFLSEMRPNPDQVYSILDVGISSTSKQAVTDHIKSQSKKARHD